MTYAADDFERGPRSGQVLGRMTEDVNAERTVVGAVEIQRGHGRIL